MAGAWRDTPGVLVFQTVTSFHFLTLYTVELASPAARAEARPEPWRLMTVAEALTATP